MEEPGPATRQELTGLTRLNQRNAACASMVRALDENMGRLLIALKEQGLYDHTTIIFTSDNGGLSTFKKGRGDLAPASVAPLRAGKGWLYEGGIRVPLLIEPAGYSGTGKTVAQPVTGTDFYPTILRLAGLEIPEGAAPDGHDLAPLLNGTATLDRQTLYWHYPHYHGSGWTPGAAMRQGDWKLLHLYEYGATELYHLGDDPGEQRNLAGQHPEKTEELLRQLLQWQKQTGVAQVRQHPYLPARKHLEKQ